MSIVEINAKLENALIAKQEAEAKLVTMETKLKTNETELTTLKEKVGIFRKSVKARENKINILTVLITNVNQLLFSTSTCF